MFVQQRRVLSPSGKVLNIDRALGYMGLRRSDAWVHVSVLLRLWMGYEYMAQRQCIENIKPSIFF